MSEKTFADQMLDRVADQFQRKTADDWARWIEYIESLPPVPPPTLRQRVRRWIGEWRWRISAAWKALRGITEDCD